MVYETLSGALEPPANEGREKSIPWLSMCI
jgi:hypothetical protein